MKTKLVLPKGCSERGADMGRANVLPPEKDAPIQLRMERLRFIDQCYDSGGAYWGLPANLYCAYKWTGYPKDQNVTTLDFDALIFVRAESRLIAKAKVINILSQATFFR